MVPVSQQEPHSYRAHLLPASLARKPAFYLQRISWLPPAFAMHHILAVAICIMHIEGVVGIVDDYNETNNQSLSFIERDTPSRTIIFDSPEALIAAHDKRVQFAGVLDTLWYHRHQLDEGDELSAFYELIPPPAHEEAAVPIGQSMIMFSSPNQERGSSFPQVKLACHIGTVPVPITLNVNLPFLRQMLTTPQQQWNDAAPPLLSAEQQATLCNAMSTAVHMCMLDPTAQFKQHS
jgi:hypothetical protein